MVDSKKRVISLDDITEENFWDTFWQFAGKMPKTSMEEQKRPDWTAYFMLATKLLATRSTCLSRPTGAIIVNPETRKILATGYNGAPPREDHCSDNKQCYRRAHKLSKGNVYTYEGCLSLHAEENAILHAADVGISIRNTEMYVTLYPCTHCIKLIKGAHIKKIIYELGYESSNKERDIGWKKSLEDSGVDVVQYKPKTSDLKYILPFLLNPTSERRLEPTE